MNLGAGVQLPEYRCHKVVRAAKITEIDVYRPTVKGEHLAVADLTLGDIGGVWTTTPKWCQEHKVEVGGYLVEYEDGYRSYSPAKAFEEGYTAITAKPATAQQEEPTDEMIDAACEAVPGLYRVDAMRVIEAALKRRNSDDNFGLTHREATALVKSWLWNPSTYKMESASSGQPWTDQQVSDAASMCMAYAAVALAAINAVSAQAPSPAASGLAEERPALDDLPGWLAKVQRESDEFIRLMQSEEFEDEFERLEKLPVSLKLYRTAMSLNRSMRLAQQLALRSQPAACVHPEQLYKPTGG